MKRFFVCLFAAVMLATTAFADLIIELDDGFWRTHRDDCISRYRSYTVNSPAGYAPLWESPVSSEQTDVLPNGTELGGLWHYTDKNGETWFAVQSGEWNGNGEEIILGWGRASDCLVTPDTVSFEEVHGTEFEGWDPAYDDVFQGVEKITLWKYPGSGEMAGELQEVPSWIRSYPSDELTVCWRDGQGRMWAYLNYIMGYRCVWLCLDDLSSTSMEKDETVLPRSETVYPAADRLPPPSTGTGGLTIVSVVSVAAITILLLLMFFRRSPRKVKSGK